MRVVCMRAYKQEVYCYVCKYAYSLYACVCVPCMRMSKRYAYEQEVYCYVCKYTVCMHACVPCMRMCFFNMRYAM